MNSIDYFNSKAINWDTICFHNSKKINEILNIVKIEKGYKVLDVGTGTGVLIPFLIERIGETGSIFAIDQAFEMLKIARAKHKFHNVEFMQDDIIKADFKTEKFDIIICYSVFPHFEDKKAALTNMKRFLAKNGKIVICHSQSKDEINKIHKKASDIVSNDILENGDKTALYFIEIGMKVDTVIDDDNMYIVIGQKKES